MAPRKTNRPTRVTSNQEQQQFGNNLGQQRPARWFRGVVGLYDPNTASYSIVGDLSGLIKSAQRVLRDPGDTSIIPEGTSVILHDAVGMWLIDGVIKEAEITPSTLPPPTISEVRGVGGEDSVIGLDGNAPQMRSRDTPVDVLAGDWVRHSPDGNMMGVLAGGTNVMQSSPFAAVRTHALDEMVEIFAHKYRHLSAMGNLEIKSVEGKTSLVWRAGSDQSDENGPDRENWTIRLDIGATGDLFDFAITQPDGNILSRLHMSASGRVELMGVEGVNIISGGDAKTINNDVVLANKVVAYDQNLTESVAKDHTATVVGTRTAQVSGNENRVVGTDNNDTVGRDWNHTVNGKVRQKALGGVTPTPGATAYELEVINGGITYVLGAAQNMTVIGGIGSNVNFAMGAGGFNVLSSLPGSVKLGADGVSTRMPDGSVTTVPLAAFGATLFEPMQTALMTLISLFDTHIHATAVGPSTPPLVPASAIVPQLVQLARSQRVTIGL